MTEDEGFERRTGPRRVRAGPGPVEREMTVASAYDDVCGRPAFVLAALEWDDAWIAVPDGAERDLEAWR